jgi:hypothetical protein
MVCLPKEDFLRFEGVPTFAVRRDPTRAHLQLAPSLPGLLHAMVQLPILREQTACGHALWTPLQRSPPRSEVTMPIAMLCNGRRSPKRVRCAIIANASDYAPSANPEGAGGVAGLLDWLKHTHAKQREQILRSSSQGR